MTVNSPECGWLFGNKKGGKQAKEGTKSWKKVIEGKKQTGFRAEPVFKETQMRKEGGVKNELILPILFSFGSEVIPFILFCWRELVTGRRKCQNWKQFWVKFSNLGE